MTSTIKRLIELGAVLLVLYIVFKVNELGGVSVPRLEPVSAKNLKTLNVQQKWPDGWGLGQARWFHHASQGTRILPYRWFVNLEKPTVVPSGRLIDDGYLERFGFLPSAKDPHFNPAGLPIGFAIEEHFDAPYACPPTQDRVVGLTCAACHTGQITYREQGVLKGVRIEGGSAMINLAAFQEAVGRALGFTLKIDTRFQRFARGVLGEKAKDSAELDALRSQLQTFLDVGMSQRDYARVHKLNGTEGGFSRTDALGLIGNRVFVAVGNENLIVPDAPVNFPPLWDTPWFDWVQYNASIRMPMVRNIGEALGVGAAVNLDERRGPLYASTVNVRNLHWMEDQLGGEHELAGLRPPRWEDTGLPKPDPTGLTCGKALYVKHCQRCHLPPVPDLIADVRGPSPNPEYWETDPRSKKRFLKLVKCDLREIGTDSNQAMNFYRRVAVFQGRSMPAKLGLFAVTEFIRRDKYRSLKPGGLSCAEVESFNRFRIFDEGTEQEVVEGKSIDEVLVANLKYKARPLDGIWATPPFLHNGSVPSLYQMLVPAARRSKAFYLGTTLFDAKDVGYVPDEFPGAFRLDTTLPGNSNAGHEFRNLSLEELESVASPSPCGSDPGCPSRARWARVLGVSEETFAGWTDRKISEKVRETSAKALEDPRVKRDHPFKGVIGPELSETERRALVEYLKTL